MPVQDNQKLGAVADLVTRVRLGRARGAVPLAGAEIFEKAFRQAVEAAGIGETDNVILLGGYDLKPAEWISPRCRTLTILEDLSDEQLSATEAGFRAKALDNVQLRWWRTGTIAVPQGTVDRAVCLNYLYRSRDPEQMVRDILFASHHGCRVVFCEPSISLDQRTARMYSTEAELSKQDQEALAAYARSAGTLRRFSREGLQAILDGAGMKEVQITEVLHGLALMATATVEF